MIGTTPVTCTATDAHGNKASKSFNVTVTSFFSGFYQPVDMGGVLNAVKNGSTVPLKFEVFGATGEIKLVSFVQQPLKAVKVACATGVARRYHRTDRHWRDQFALRHNWRPVHLQLANAEGPRLL